MATGDTHETVRPDQFAILSGEPAENFMVKRSARLRPIVHRLPVELDAAQAEGFFQLLDGHPLLRQARQFGDVRREHVHSITKAASGDGEHAT